MVPGSDSENRSKRKLEFVKLKSSTLRGDAGQVALVDKRLVKLGLGRGIPTPLWGHDFSVAVPLFDPKIGQFLLI